LEFYSANSLKITIEKTVVGVNGAKMVVNKDKKDGVLGVVLGSRVSHTAPAVESMVYGCVALPICWQ
jgi:hypothetical protein